MHKIIRKRLCLPPVALLACAMCGCAAPGLRHAPAEDRIATGQAVSPADAKASPGANTHAPRDQRASVNLHIFGLSYHPDRQGTRLSHLDNELNFGLGLGYKLYEDDLRVFHSEAGAFKDSGSNLAKYAGMSYLFKLDEHWNVGADVFLGQSRTYNFGKPFLAVLPHLTRDFEKVRLNAVYIPRYKEVNRFSAFAFYLTVPLWN